MLISKKLLYFYFGYFGLNSIVSIIAPIYGISESLIYILLLVLSLSLIGFYFYVYYRKEDYFAPFSQFFILYGFFNLVMMAEYWPFWLIATIGTLDLIGLIIYYYVNNRRNRRFR